MRDLILLRDSPGAGKNTWIKEHKLSQYTLNRDEICRSCPAYITDPFIFQKPFSEKIQQIKAGIIERADKILLEKVKARMKNNELY
jgi:predicted kinase